MTYENIIVRADFIDGKVVPLGFQITRNSPYHPIGRVISTKKSYKLANNTTTYECCMARCDEIATLQLKNDDNILSWSVSTDLDLTKPISKTDNEQATDLLVENKKFRKKRRANNGRVEAASQKIKSK